MNEFQGLCRRRHGCVYRFSVTWRRLKGKMRIGGNMPRKNPELHPTRCENCHGRFPKKVKPAGAHVLEVGVGSVPPGAIELGKHYFCTEACCDAYSSKLTKKYTKAG